MNWREYVRPIITALVGLGIIVLVIVLFVKLLTGGSKAPTNTLDVGKYADTAATATLLIDAPTNLDQEHYQVKITVSQTQNEIDIIKGYQGTVSDSRTYPNNSVAYGTFLQSLKLVNFAKGNNDKAAADYRGYCPSGERYVFSFNDGQTDRFDYWSSSCGQGTYKGNRAATLQLFRRQIAEQDFDKLTSNISLGY